MPISQSEIQRLERGTGSIAFDSTGTGPLVICVPGMGDLRSSYRFIVPVLADAGFRVVVVDLRGHGDSDTSFNSFDDEALASDLIALIEQLGGPASIVGNSMGAGAAVIAAAARPDLVTGLVLLGAFVRNPPSNPVLTLIYRVLSAPLWVAAVWKAILPSLYKGRKPADFAEYLAEVNAAMRRPGYGKAFSRTMGTTHRPAELAAPSVTASALVIMGALDPDFADPSAEAAWIATQFPAETLVVDDCGHYPQSQQPEIVAPAIRDFLTKTTNA
jgi:pimeloyl-ACP methyl ester carboxylesterase